jgi:predicted dehydrogenase
MTVRWGLLGCGDIVRKRVARAILDESHSRLVAACRRDEARLQEFCHDFSVPRSYRDESGLIADPEVDAVYIATPVSRHRDQTLAAARAGKHVLVEKPMARSVAECQEMIDACREHKVRLGVAYYRRFYPVVWRIKELIAAGEIGRPLSVSATTATPFAIAPDEDGYWRVHGEEGGGSLMDVGSHRINLFLDLFGKVTDVKAFCDTLAGDYEAEDVATLVLRFGPGMHGTLQCFFGTPAGLDEFAVIGTEGALRADPLNDGSLLVDRGRERRHEHLPPADNLHAPLIADFVAAVLEGRPPRVTGEEGLWTNEVMERAYQDARRR